MAFDPTRREREVKESDALRRRAARHGGEKKVGQEIDLSDGQGLLVKRIIQPGNGELIPLNSKAIVHYTGMFEDKKIFDSSVRQGRPFSFLLGQHEVILGWDVGVASMQRGEKATLKCTPNYGYGSKGVDGVIPPNTDLYFEIELLDWVVIEKKTNYLAFIASILFVVAIVTYVLFYEDEVDRAKKAAQNLL